MINMDNLIDELGALKEKAESYDRLVMDLTTILQACYVDKSTFQREEEISRPKNAKVPKIKRNSPVPRAGKCHALWRCNKCGAFNIRSSKHIKLSPHGGWEFTDTVQSPCPITSCDRKQRLSPKNTRIYVDWAEAQTHKEFFEKHSATEWLD